MNKKVKNIISRAFIISGLATTAATIYDSAQNNFLNDELNKRHQITKNLQETYNINRECYSSGQPLAAVCTDTVKEAKNKEDEERILDEYYAELHQALSEIPSSPEAHARGFRDSVELLAGLAVASIGVQLGSSKEHKS